MCCAPVGKDVLSTENTLVFSTVCLALPHDTIHILCMVAYAIRTPHPTPDVLYCGWRASSMAVRFNHFVNYQLFLFLKKAKKRKKKSRVLWQKVNNTTHCLCTLTGHFGPRVPRYPHHNAPIVQAGPHDTPLLEPKQSSVYSSRDQWNAVPADLGLVK